ncbi:prepilin peptidase [Evansella sp. AB-P1]|uniref:A24 family peptidase n=1 Tax=Evansella sp. AB-P1 TaxID=3037653 RepID=UPI00241E487B|nr:prepilin peptidase [Evansella sp. AB-P1]MDG5790057.1 prepilin peptidase [Evansella sp. AB-P1]
MLLLNVLLFCVLIICTFTDLRSRKIYNKVIFPSLVLALLINGVLLGWQGIWSSLLGFSLGLGILLIPYLLGGMGAGDVKLLALIGAIHGVSFVFATAVYMALIGGVIGLCILIFRKGFLQRIKSFFYTLVGLKLGMKPSVPLNKRIAFPYGVAIAVGAFLAFFLQGVELL